MQSVLTIICIYLHPYVRTGGHRRYLELVRGLAARGHRCVLFADPRLSADLPVVNVVPLHPSQQSFFKSLPLPKSTRFAAAVRTALRRGAVQAADLVLVFGETHFAAARVVSRRLRIPMLFAFRSLPVDVGNIELAQGGKSALRSLVIRLRVAKYRLYERAVSRHAARIVFQSGFDRDRYLSRVPRAAAIARVIRGNIAEPWFPASARHTNRSTGLSTILCIGAISERKGVAWLVNAFLQVAGDFPTLRLDIAGTGGLRTVLEQRVAAAGLSQRVRFLGHVTDPLSLIAAADLLVVPSLFDSYPNTVLEALHVGTPVIASRVGGIPDMLEHHELLFPPADASAIAGRIRLLATDPAAYRRARDLCGRRRSYFEFDWPAEWERVMREMVGQGSGEK
ncbi:MAG: glycosyltransferase family 1 protein [Spirochaetaceae bacterium]|nr:MAG: glycosyltransferase family 1 protein [Spirochaetaceae bacterium]